MPLFIATGSPPALSDTLSKGLLQNLETGEWMDFQFNPETFEYGRDQNWGESLWKGDERGGDLQYVNTGPHAFDLSLLYVADPSAPNVPHNASVRVSPAPDDSRLPVSFERIEQVIYKWTEPLADLGRPPRIGISIGPREFKGVILNHQSRITEFFSDLTAREALLNIRFREWQILKST